MAVLKPFFGRDEGATYQLDECPCRLGRAIDCEIHDLFAGFSAVSRHHAEIFVKDGEYHIRDTSSRNGTWVNDIRIVESTQLRNGDRISIGGIELVFADGTTEFPLTHVSEEDCDSSFSKTVGLRALLQQGIVRADAQLRAMVEMLAGLRGSLDVKEVMEYALQALLKIFEQADEAFVGLGDSFEKPRVAAVRFRNNSRDGRVHISRTVAERATRSQSAILSEEVALDARFSAAESLQEWPIRSLMCAPILNTQEECIGFLQLNSLRASQRFRERDLDVLVAVSTLISAAIQFASAHEISLEKQAAEQDLRVARLIQETLLPTKRPELDGWTFDKYYRAARHVGGDYFDYLPLPDGRLAVLVADACGKGVSAAILISIMSGELKSCLAGRLDPAAALARVNSRLLDAECDNKFVTLLMVVIDTQTGSLEVFNAGHFDLLIRRSDGAVAKLGAHSRRLPLGIERDVCYSATKDTLGLGESLVLFSDGLTDAMNNKDECYRVKRIVNAVGSSDHQDASSLVSHIISDVQGFVGANRQFDDMCLVCVHRSQCSTHAR
jgi:serine phosphatase RsbU (regulator of sigma subunit)/pSer/pThr/pTyr-binding forkhead associated (FHA) protein